jgi:hypothetical protein
LVEIRVTEKGVGMYGATHKKIVQLFFIKPAGQGTGLRYPPDARITQK